MQLGGARGRGLVLPWTGGGSTCTAINDLFTFHTYTPYIRFSSSLQGTLPPSLLYATTLQTLTLSGNYLTGTLPASWSALTALTAVDISANRLTGTLPPAWGSASALSLMRTINLANNGFWSTIPPSWGTGLPAIVRILVDGNPLL